jgi:hypothetical protein
MCGKYIPSCDRFGNRINLSHKLLTENDFISVLLKRECREDNVAMTVAESSIDEKDTLEEVTRGKDESRFLIFAESVFSHRYPFSHVFIKISVRPSLSKDFAPTSISCRHIDTN